MTEVEGRFRYEPADVVQGLRRMLRPAIAVGILILLALVGLVARTVARRGPGGFFADPILLGLAVVGFASLAYGLWLGPRRVATAYARKLGARDVTVRLDDAGFTLQVPDRLFLRHDWPEIDFVRETPTLFIVHLAQDLPYFLPKRAFSTQGAQEVRDLARRKGLLR